MTEPRPHGSQGRLAVPRRDWTTLPAMGHPGINCIAENPAHPGGIPPRFTHRRGQLRVTAPFGNALVLQLYFWACPPFVVPILGDALMPAAPRRPGQNLFHFLLRGQHKTPEETTNLADTQRHASPRVALNVANMGSGS